MFMNEYHNLGVRRSWSTADILLSTRRPCGEEDPEEGMPVAVRFS